jgi:dihydrodipicolinate synthase/N-acetylneuraminate lyase
MKQIKGPVIPIPTAFNQDETVDLDSIFTYVSKLVDLGIKNIMTTVGTSRYNLLSFKECMKVNETIVKACNNKAISIVANPIYGGTKHAIDFAKHADKIGADYFLLYYPERYYGEDNIYKFFKKIADSTKLPILIHEMPMRNGFGPGTVQYSIPLLKRLLTIDNIVGFKEESLDVDYSNSILENFPNAVCIGAGGGMSRYLYRDFKRGAKAYLGGLGNFYPKIELDFFNAIQNGNYDIAKNIVEQIELKYFEEVVPIGWHPHLKYAISFAGLLPEFEREPMKTLDAKEKEIIHNLFSKFKFK